MKINEKCTQKLIQDHLKSEPQAPKIQIFMILKSFGRCPFWRVLGSYKQIDQTAEGFKPAAKTGRWSKQAWLLFSRFARSNRANGSCRN